jgi:pyridoxine 4-dehydrogenase
VTDSTTAAAAGTITIGGDLTVNRLGFGAMRITGDGIWGEPKDPDEAKRVLRRAVELGVNFIDWRADGRPQHLREAIEGSLSRLKLDRIDLYQFHRPDRRVPLEDSIGTLVELRDEGKIRHIGVSNFSVPQLETARAITEVVSVQNRHNLGDRSSDDVLAFCEQNGLAFLPWAPLQNASGAVERVATSLGVTVNQVALAWLLAQSPWMLPIPGTGSVAHLEENVAAASLRLGDEQLAQLNG